MSASPVSLSDPPPGSAVFASEGEDKKGPWSMSRGVGSGTSAGWRWPIVMASCRRWLWLMDQTVIMFPLFPEVLGKPQTS